MNLMKCCVIFLLILLINATPGMLFAADEQRQAYDKMVEEATREADAYVEQKQQEQKASAEKKQRQMDATLEERVKAERKRLETEIDKVWKRGLGPNFTEGMRQNQLQELGDKLDLLNSDPQAYFGE